jgi:hypothetical protein
MTIVKFKHDGEVMSTSAENWINFSMFDAVKENGDTYPVNKEDCELISTEER